MDGPNYLDRSFQLINQNENLTPGKHPLDPFKEDLDPVAFALKQTKVFLVWIDEHLSSFEKLRESDVEEANRELGNLRDAAEQAILYMNRLSELVLSGSQINPSKRMPRDLSSPGWIRLVDYIRRKREAEIKERKEKGTP